MKAKLIVTTDDGQPIATRDVLLPYTTQSHWDCDCKDHFHRWASEEICPKCLARAKSSPDSITEEILGAGLPIREITIDIL